MDLATAREILKHNPVWHDFCEMYWDEFKNFVIVQDYSTDILVTRHGESSRTVYILLSGILEAYTVTREDPNLVPIYRFNEAETIGDVQGIFGDPITGSAWTFGLQSLSKVHLLAIDLETFEHTCENVVMYEAFFDNLYQEIGMLTEKINNLRLKENIKISELLPQKFFHDLKSKDLTDLHNYLSFHFFDVNNYLYNKGEELDNIYFLLTGSIEKTNQDHSEELVGHRVLGEIAFFNGGVGDADIRTVTPCFVLTFNLKNFLKSNYEDLKTSIYQKFIQHAQRHLDSTQKKFKALQIDYKENYLKPKTFAILSVKALLILCVINILLYIEDRFHIFAGYEIILHKVLAVTSLVLIFLLIKKSDVSFKKLGFVVNYKAFAMGLFFMILLGIISVIWNELILDYTTNSALTFIYPLYINQEQIYSGIYWYYLILILLYTTMYEIIVRGIWQNWLFKLFTGNYWVKSWKAIFPVNFLGAGFYYSLFYKFYLIMFLAGILYGYLYAKYRNLYAVIISHFLFEILLISQVGFIVF